MFLKSLRWSAWISKSPVSMVVARRSRHGRLANRSTSSRSTPIAHRNRRSGFFEAYVILSILQRTDHCLGRQPMADGIAARSLFPSFGFRPCALERLRRLASICRSRGHGEPHSKFGSFCNFAPDLTEYARRWMCLSTTIASGHGRIDACLFPPGDFIATAVDFRWWPRHNGTVNSSLTLRPSAA